MVSMKDIRTVARRIGREFKPDKVILFGSYAYGKPTEDSDVDFLVVMRLKNDSVEEFLQVTSRIRRALNFPFATDILVRDPRVIRQRIAWNDFFLKEITEKGKVLYESGRRRVGEKSRGGFRNHAARAPRSQEAKLR